MFSFTTVNLLIMAKIKFFFIISVEFKLWKGQTVGYRNNQIYFKPFLSCEPHFQPGDS